MIVVIATILMRYKHMHALHFYKYIMRHYYARKQLIFCLGFCYDCLIVMHAAKIIRYMQTDLYYNFINLKFNWK